MWTQILATYAAVVSTASLAIAYISYKAGGPRLSGRAAFSSWDSDSTIYAEIWNSGRGPVSIRGFRLDYNADQKQAGFVYGSLPLALNQTVMPIRLDSGAGRGWAFSTGGITRFLTQPGLKRLRVVVTLGNGKELTLPVHRDSMGGGSPHWYVDRSDRGTVGQSKLLTYPIFS
jgi:hypothetical protein